jgi:hypothetical protein
VRKFRCGACGGWFSSSCFSADYWNKLPGLTAPVYAHLANGQALRQVARTLGVSHTTVRRRERWIARQCLLHHLEQRERLRGQLGEPLVLDGLRTFAGSQYEPLDLNTIVTSETGFMLDIAAAPLRRSGQMTPRQRRVRRARDWRLGRPAPRIRYRATRASLQRLVPLLGPGGRLELRSDEEPDYARAVRSLGARWPIDHQTTSSRQRRDERNPLWQINHKHRVMRHSLKSQARETLAFHKTLAGLLDRVLTSVTWLNNTKGITERTAAGSRQTPAMKLGLESHPLSGEELFAQRRFPDREGLPGWARPLYEGRVKARPREPLAVSIPKYAY